MAITPLSSGVTRCLHHILVFAIIEATPDTVGDRIWRNRGRGLAELPGEPLSGTVAPAMCSLGPTNQASERNLGAGAGFALLVYLNRLYSPHPIAAGAALSAARPCSLAKGGTPRKAVSITKK